MFRRIFSHKGFWKSVFVLMIIYTVVLLLLQYIFKGFPDHFFNLQTVGVALLAGFVAGMFSSYGKFWGKLKTEDYKKNEH